MTCGSGCCGPSRKLNLLSDLSRDNDRCSDDFPAVEKNARNFRGSNDDGSICEQIKCADQAKRDCCKRTSVTPLSSSESCMKDLACGNSHCSLQLTGNNCKEDCCSELRDNNAAKAPICCQGKPSPCCDTSCLERLALRECQAEKSKCQDEGQLAAKSSRPSSRASSRCLGVENGKACNHHTRETSEKYAVTLEAIGCICRALLALGQESCCKPPIASFAERASYSKISSARPSLDSCCATGAVFTGPAAKDRCHKAIPGDAGKSCAKGCCTTPKTPKVKDNSCSKGCCSKPKTAPEIDVTRSTKCCEDKKREICVETEGVICTNDPEKGKTCKEHVVLSVSGMTCTGCETKLQRTLAAVSSVKNLKTSLVLARVEFDVEIGAESVADIIRHLERTTEFKFEKISNQGSNLDVITPIDSANFVDQAWPEGVKEIKIVEKNIAQITFDPKVVGARDLLEKGWGTPIQLAPPRADPSLDAGNKHVRHVGYMTLLSAILTIPVLVLAWAPLPENEIAYSSASLALATIVQFAIAGPFYPKALKSLIFSRLIEMDLLIVLSTTAAYVFSLVSFGYLVSGKPLSTGSFFETSTLLVTLIMVGRYVSAFARQKAVESISIRSLQTPTATIIDETGGEKEIDVRLFHYGDVFKVAPHTTVPTDGTVISGSSELDESMITGESRPVEKYAKSTVLAGSINGSGMLTIRLTRLPGENTISTIAGMVDEAKLSKPRIQDIADRVASYFVPVVLTLTIITLVIWIAIGIAVRRQSGTDAAIQALTYAIAVLIVSCPCAIGLAVPMVIVIASGVAAERGVIFKSAESIEIAYKTSHVVFDKTGTLTQGKLTVSQEIYTHDDPKTSKSLLLGLIGSIKHPVSAAVAAHLKEQGISASFVSDPTILTGKGVEGTASGMILRAGNSRWLDVTSNAEVQLILSQGYSTFCFTIDGSLAAIYALEDTLRSDAAQTVAKLRERGISVHVISGDDDGAVQSVATQLEIPTSNIRSRCSPATKREYIQSLLATPVFDTRRPKKPTVIFCGDGTNDAVALAQATIGVHMGHGTDIAKAAADVVLMRPDLSGVLTMIAVSKKSMNRVAFNFSWSFIYNLFAVLLAAGAFVNARIPPQYAGLGELVSVLPVIICAMLLRMSKI